MGCAHADRFPKGGRIQEMKRDLKSAPKADGNKKKRGEKKPTDSGHKARFEQLLGDAIFGVKKKG